MEDGQRIGLSPGYEGGERVEWAGWGYMVRQEPVWIARRLVLVIEMPRRPDVAEDGC